MYAHGMIAPVIALVIWSLIMLIWLYATRIPAMAKAKVKPGEATKAQMESLPGGAANVANNYNHLMEQPTLFYALALYAQVAGHADPLNVGLAWGYVVLRAAHSVIQCTSNNVTIRFYLFAASTLMLIILAGHEIVSLLS